MKCIVKPVDDFDPSETKGLQELKTDVYPPEETVAWEGASREWSSPQWGVLTDAGKLASSTGFIRRDGSVV